MSRTWNHHKSGYYGNKKGFKTGTKVKHRALEREVLSKIKQDVELADELIINRYQDCDDWWAYD